MSTEPADIVVIGAGVTGLSVAAVLLRAGHSVTVYAAEPPERTTSAVAGAMWGPHLVGADDRVHRWARLTLERFRDLAAEPAAGVRIRAGLVASAGQAAAVHQGRRTGTAVRPGRAPGRVFGGLAVLGPGRRHARLP